MPIAAYGSWKSPISSDLIVSNSIRLGADSIGADGGDAGKITADGDILTGAITSNVSNGSGNGGNIAIASLGNFESGNITTASNAGNAGYIKIAAGSLTELDKNIKVGDLVASSAASGNDAKTGGVVLLKASGNIESGKIFTSSVTGNAGNIALNADLGITVGNIDASANGDGNAGSVTLVATEDIEALAIKANVSGTGIGSGGKVKLVSKEGDILTDYVRTDSAGGVGGNITVDAGSQISNGIGGTIRAMSSFNIDGVDLSFFTGIREGAAIDIKYRPMSFTVGDSSKNGTKGSLMSSASVVTDLKIENSFKLASLNNRTEIIVQSSAPDIRTDLQKKVDNAVNASYQSEYSKTIASTVYLDLFTSLILFLRNPLFGVITTIFNYFDKVRTLEKAKALTKAAALKDSEFKNNETLAAQYILPDINRLLVSAQKFSVTDNAQIAYILATVSHETKFGQPKLLGLSDGNNGLYEKSNAKFKSHDDFLNFQKEYQNRPDLSHYLLNDPDPKLAEKAKANLVNGLAIDGYAFRGRGYVQLTGRVNYDKLGKDFRMNFLTITPSDPQNQNPENWTYAADIVATDRNLAADITVYGMKRNRFAGSPEDDTSRPDFGGYLNEINLNTKKDFENARYLVNNQDVADIIADNALEYFDSLKNYRSSLII